MRLDANRGGDNPVSGAQVRGKPAGDAEADHAPIAAGGRSIRHRLQLVPGCAAHDMDAGAGGYAGLEGQSDECDDQDDGMFDRDVRRP